MYVCIMYASMYVCICICITNPNWPSFNFIQQTLTVSEQLVLISRSSGLIGVHGQALDIYIFIYIYICIYI